MPHRREAKAADGIRTRDLVLTKDALYQLSYSSRSQNTAPLPRGKPRRIAGGNRSYQPPADRLRSFFVVALTNPPPQPIRTRAREGVQKFNSTPPVSKRNWRLERAKGIEPSRPAWKAGALPLSYARNTHITTLQLVPAEPSSSGAQPRTTADHTPNSLPTRRFGTHHEEVRPRGPNNSPEQVTPMGEAGFEPAKAEPPDLQSGPFGHSGIPPLDLKLTVDSTPPEKCP